VTAKSAKAILLLASAYNLSGGLSIVFLLDALAPLVGMAHTGNMLFRLFVGGTAITFGLAYLYVARSGKYREPILFFGTGLKYWAFVAAIVSYAFYDLSLAMLLLFGVANLSFALLFTLILKNKAVALDRQGPTTAGNALLNVWSSWRPSRGCSWSMRGWSRARRLRSAAPCPPPSARLLQSRS
jgi:hypothetical protein